MSKVHESLQQLFALTEASDIDGISALVANLLPGELDQVADQLRALDKGGQADALLRIKENQQVESLTDVERAAAEWAGMPLSQYAKLKGARP